MTGFPTQRGGYAEDLVVPSAARTANGATGVLANYGSAVTLRWQLDVTAVSGTDPTLDVWIDDTLDGINWNPIQSLAATTPVAQITAWLSPFADRLRVRWTIGGTDDPSFTFSVIIVAQTR